MRTSGVDHSRELHVIDVATTAREDPLVLEPPDPGARVSLTDGCHGAALLRKIGDAPRDVRERGTGRRVSSPRSEWRFLAVRPARSAAALSAPINRAHEGNGRPVKPAAFEYHEPGSVEEVVALLAEHGDEAKIIAGGQSLVPMMSMRLARPTHLVDVIGVGDSTGSTTAATTSRSARRQASAPRSARRSWPRASRCWPKRCPSSATCRSATGARSAGAWPTPTRRRSSPRSRWSPMSRS